MPRASYQDAVSGAQRDLAEFLKQYPDLQLSDADKQNIVLQSLPSYQSDWNGLQEGRSLISQHLNQLHQVQANSPLAIQQRQQAQWNQQAPQHADSINQIVQTNLGRAATPDELSHYGSLIASGAADPYAIQQFIQATPEYQNAADAKFRQGVDTQLQQSDTNFFNTQKGNIAQQYAQMGRATSPALDVALTQLASQLNSNRQGYLAQLSANQYSGNKQAAQQTYENTRQNTANQIAQNTGAMYGNTMQNNQDLVNNRNFASQQNQWYNMQGQFAQKPNWMDYLNAGLGAAKGGAQIYGASKGGT